MKSEKAIKENIKARLKKNWEVAQDLFFPIISRNCVKREREWKWLNNLLRLVALQLQLNSSPVGLFVVLQIL